MWEASFGGEKQEKYLAILMNEFKYINYTNDKEYGILNADQMRRKPYLRRNGEIYE